MVHLRIVVPSYQAEHTLDPLNAATLFTQRRVYLRQRVAHLQDDARGAAGLPIGRSRRVGSATYKTPDGA